MSEAPELRPYLNGVGSASSPSRPEALGGLCGPDAELRYSTPGVRVADPKACQCGEVLKGAKPP